MSDVIVCVRLQRIFRILTFNQQECTMRTSMSLERITTSPSSAAAEEEASSSTATLSGAIPWIYGKRQRSSTLKRPQYKHLYWILISLNIFIALAYCDDDIISPSAQPFPQKRSGGK